MSARFVPGATITVELLGRGLTDERIAADPGIAAGIRDAFDAFARALRVSSSA